MHKRRPPMPDRFHNWLIALLSVGAVFVVCGGPIILYAYASATHVNPPSSLLILSGSIAAVLGLLCWLAMIPVYLVGRSEATRAATQKTNEAYIEWKRNLTSRPLEVIIRQPNLADELRSKYSAPPLVEKPRNRVKLGGVPLPPSADRSRPLEDYADPHAVAADFRGTSAEDDFALARKLDVELSHGENLRAAAIFPYPEGLWDACEDWFPAVEAMVPPTRRASFRQKGFTRRSAGLGRSVDFLALDPPLAYLGEIIEDLRRNGV